MRCAAITRDDNLLLEKQKTTGSGTHFSSFSHKLVPRRAPHSYENPFVYVIWVPGMLHIIPLKFQSFSEILVHAAVRYGFNSERYLKNPSKCGAVHTRRSLTHTSAICDSAVSTPRRLTPPVRFPYLSKDTTRCGRRACRQVSLLGAFHHQAI